MSIKSKPPTKEYEDGWDRIFGKKSDKKTCEANQCSCAGHCFDEERIDVIGTNGNDGLHYPFGMSQEGYIKAAAYLKEINEYSLVSDLSGYEIIHYANSRRERKENADNSDC